MVIQVMLYLNPHIITVMYIFSKFYSNKNCITWRF